MENTVNFEFFLKNFSKSNYFEKNIKVNLNSHN